MTANRARSFVCPLRGPCFSDAGETFLTYQALNDAVSGYQAAATAPERDAAARRIYQLCLPLVRKTLRRFCHPFRTESRCYPGACQPEELVGESFTVFHRALEAYDPSLGVDFLGYLSQRLYWGLEHHARWTERAATQLSVSGALPEVPSDTPEDAILDRVLLNDLLDGLGDGDAALLVRHAAGYTSEELAEAAGATSAAVRKRLERLRSRLREQTGGG